MDGKRMDQNNQYTDENKGEEAATTLPSRLDAHGTRKKRRHRNSEEKKKNETETFSPVQKDYLKSPMVARVLLILFIVLVTVTFSLAIAP